MRRAGIAPAPLSPRRLPRHRGLAAFLLLFAGLLGPRASWADEPREPDVTAHANATARTSEAPSRFEPLLRASLGSGYDGNVTFAPRGAVEDPLGFDGQGGAWFGTAGLTLGVGRSFDALRVDVSYDLYQTAYQAPFRASSFHQQALELRASDPGYRLIGWELALRGDLSFTGAGNLQPFQRSGAIEPELVVGRRRPVRLRVGGQILALDTLDPELAYLSGHRLEARATPELVLAGWRVSLPLRWRLDRTGNFRGPPLPMDPSECLDCTFRSVSPTRNQAWIGGLRLSTPFGWTVRPGLAARFEHRNYLEAEHDLVEGPEGTERTRRRFRTDRRWWLEANLRVNLTESWSLVARYQLGQSTTWLLGSGAGLESRSYRRPVALIELEADWM